MIDSIGPTLSALDGFRKKMDVTADNIANVNTDGFKKKRLTFQEEDQGGVQPVVEQVNTPGVIKEAIRNGQVTEVESSNVDLTEELPEMIITRSAYSANLKTLKTKDDMTGTVLDILS